MHNKSLFFTAGLVTLAFCLPSARATELMLNGNFEGPVTIAGGNNLGTVPTNWTVQNASGTTDSSVSDLTRGVVTNGTGNGGSNNLPLDPYDTGSGDMQSLDVSGNGSVTQVFTAVASSPVTVKVDFGGRDSGSPTSTGSYWSIYNNSTNALVATDSATPIKPAFGGWSTSTITTTVSLTDNTQYRFVVTLDNPDQVDGVSLQQVPEPTTLTAAGIGLGLLGWVGIQRRRRS